MMRFRAISSFVTLVTPAMLHAAQPGAETEIRVRANAPAMTLDAARAMSPQALADALLQTGHPPVARVAIGPQGMEPPPPPGGPRPTRIKLYLQPVSSDQAGFCQRTVATVYLNPVRGGDKDASFRIDPTSLATEVGYHWIGKGDLAACRMPSSSFFTPRRDLAVAALATMRLLASAKDAAKRGGHLAFPISVDDKEGAQLLELDRRYPDHPPARRTKIITDAKKALAMLPLESANYVGPSSRGDPDILQPSDLVNAKHAPVTGMTVFSDDWIVGMVVVDGRIVRMRLAREIPAPF